MPRELTKTTKQLKETIQDLKMEEEAIQKTQTQGTLEMKNVIKQTGTAHASITNRLQEMEDSQALKIRQRKQIHLSKKTLNLKTPNTKHPGNLVHNGKDQV